MGHRLRMLVVVTSLLTTLSPGVPGPSSAAAATHDAASDLAYVEQLLYATPLGDFVALAKKPDDVWFDWTTDLCSAPLVGNTGASFNFTNACRRHDFGYRNLKLLERRYGSGSTYWNATRRERVDLQLRADTRAHCATRSVLLRPNCLAWSEAFFRAVRIAGGP